MAKEKTPLLLKINESGNNFSQWQAETLVEELGSAFQNGRDIAQGSTIEECLTKAIGAVKIAAPGATLSKDDEESNKDRGKAKREFKLAESKMLTHILKLISQPTRDWLSSKSLVMSGATVVYSTLLMEGDVVEIIKFIAKISKETALGETHAIMDRIIGFRKNRQDGTQTIDEFQAAYQIQVKTLENITGSKMTNQILIVEFVMLVNSRYIKACNEAIKDIEFRKVTTATSIDAFVALVSAFHTRQEREDQLKADATAAEKAAPKAASALVADGKPKAKSTDACNYYSRTGKCRYGDKCRFAHVEAHATATASAATPKAKKFERKQKGKGKANAVKASLDDVDSDFGSVTSNDSESAYPPLVNFTIELPANIMAVHEEMKEERTLLFLFDTGANVSITKDHDALERGPFKLNKAISVKGYGGVGGTEVGQYGFTAFGRTLYDPTSPFNIVSDHQVTKRKRFRVSSQPGSYTLHNVRSGLKYIFSKDNRYGLPILRASTNPNEVNMTTTTRVRGSWRTRFADDPVQKTAAAESAERKARAAAQRDREAGEAAARKADKAKVRKTAAAESAERKARAAAQRDREAGEAAARKADKAQAKEARKVARDATDAESAARKARAAAQRDREAGEAAARKADKAYSKEVKEQQSISFEAQRRQAAADLEAEMRNKHKFSPAQLRRVQLCSELYECLGYPGDEPFRTALRTGCYLHSEVTEQDFLNLRALKGPSREHKFGHLTYNESGGQYVVAERPGQHIHCDIYFVEGPYGPIPIHVGVDERTGFGHAANLKDGKKTTAALMVAQESMVNFFRPYGHTPEKLFYDRESNISATDRHVNRLGCLLVQAPAGEHEKICERYIRTLNGIMRSIASSLPFKIPSKLFASLLFHAVDLSNVMPNVKTSGQAPRLLVTHTRVNAQTHLAHKWGDAGIFKGSTGNLVGIVVRTDWNSRNSCKVWSPDTNEFYSTSSTNVHKMVPDAGLISRINAIADKKPTALGSFLVEPDGSPLAILRGGEIWTAPVDPAEAASDAVAEAVDADNAVGDAAATVVDEPQLIQGDPEFRTAPNTPNRDVGGVDSVPRSVPKEIIVPTDTQTATPRLELGLGLEVQSSAIKASPKKRRDDLSINNGHEDQWEVSGPRRPRALTAAVHLALSSKEEFSRASEKVKQSAVQARRSEVFGRSAEGANFSSAPPGIKAAVFNIALKKMMQSEKGKASSIKEIKQLLDLSVFKPRHWETLTAPEKQNIINFMIFGKEKRNGDMKARGVGLGNGQDRSMYKNTDLSSPTVSSETVFTQLAVAAFEKRDVLSLDVPGAYLHAEQPKGEGRPTVIVRINPIIVGIMVALDKNLEKYICADGCIYMEVMKALYGLIESAYLWYKTYCADLFALGFSRSLYDVCFFYHTEKKTHISLHVDDSLVTYHKSEDGRQHRRDLVAYMKKRYGGITVHRLDKEGEIDFLGMRITKPGDGSIRIDQENYLNKMCEQFGVSALSSTPGDETLFDIDEDSPPSKDPKRFTSAVMTVMYAALRTKPETLVTTAWLSGRCRAPTEQDDRKLAKLLAYCNKYAILGKRMMPKSLQLHAYADASHNVHPDCKGHAGSVIGMGGSGSSIFTQSSKIKLQGRSSAEDELYGADRVVSMLQHRANFMEEIGYPQGAIPFAQDNQSTIVMCEKGHSNDGRSRHIKARYFYIKTLIDGGRIKVYYLPTGKMVADILTKPLTGALFRKFRRMLLGEFPADED